MYPIRISYQTSVHMTLLTVYEVYVSFQKMFLNTGMVIMNSGFLYHTLKTHYDSASWAAFFSTVKYKIFRPFWGFVTRTPTRALPLTCRGAYSVPRPPAVFSNDHTIIAYHVQDTTEYPSPSWGGFLKCILRRGKKIFLH